MKYVRPELNIELVEAADIITASGNGTSIDDEGGIILPDDEG